MNKVDIIKQFQPSLSEESLEIIRLFSDIENRMKTNNALVKEINDVILKRQSQLKNKLVEADIKINTALFGDKKFFTETYSFEVPIEKEYFKDDNFSIKEGIITPKTRLKSDKNKKVIDFSSITSRRSTDFKILNGKLYLDKNLQYPYQELEINLPKDVGTGILYLTLDKFEKISILNRFGREIEETAIKNSIALPVNSETKTVIIRFENNKNKVLQIKNMYIAENSYESSTTIETKNIYIGQYLQEFGINTCDNYSDNSVDMKYYASINNGEYREIRPLNKHKNLDVKSILPTDDTLNQVTLEQALITDLGSMYLLDHLDSPDFHIIKSFKGKLGDNVGRSQGSSVSFYVKEPLSIILNAGSSLELNGEHLDIDTDGYVLNFKEGFNTISVDSLLWNQREDLLRYSVEGLEGNTLVLKDKYSEDIITKVVEDPTARGSESVFLQLINKVDIFTEEYTAEPVFINNTKYIKKESHDNTYLFIKFKTRYVETIKIKVDMNTNNPNIPAYISSLMIRGV